MMLEFRDGCRYAAGNVSIGGVGFELAERVKLTPGERFSVRIAIPDTHEPIDLQAELRHLRFIETSGRYYGGGKFINLDELSEYPLFRFVEEVSVARLAHAVVP